jgi:predicted nucleic-acid-binding protein
MIGLDTIVLVRFFTEDDPELRKEAEVLMASFTPENPAWVSTPVILCLDWELRKNFPMKRAQLVDIYERLFNIKELLFDNAEAMNEALELFKNGKAGFADCMISCTARHAGCNKIVTFDKIAARDAGMTLLV